MKGPTCISLSVLIFFVFFPPQLLLCEIQTILSNENAARSSNVKWGTIYLHYYSSCYYCITLTLVTVAKLCFKKDVEEKIQNTLSDQDAVFFSKTLLRWNKFISCLGILLICVYKQFIEKWTLFTPRERFDWKQSNTETSPHSWM